jgi:pilus assembly protein CpaB
MEKYRPLLLLGAAVVVALITSLFAYNWLQQKAESSTVEAVELEPVAVAVADLSWGTVLKKEMVRMIPFRKGSLPAESFYSDRESLAGKVVISPIKAKEPILASRLAADNVTDGGVTAVIKGKKRAIAVKVDRVIGVSGFIQPGDRVDVLVTITDPRNKAVVTKTVLENMLVIAVGARMEQAGEKGKRTAVDVITLEVTPEESEKLALATTEGRIKMVLRGKTDTEEVLTRGTTVARLLDSYHPGSPPPKPKAAPTKARVKAAPKPLPKKKPAFSVWVVNGSNVQESKRR